MRGGTKMQEVRCKRSLRCKKRPLVRIPIAPCAVLNDDLSITRTRVKRSAATRVKAEALFGFAETLCTRSPSNRAPVNDPARLE